MSYGMPVVPGRAGPGDELGLVAPAKVLRLIHLLRSTLDELERAPLDDATRRRVVGGVPVSADGSVFTVLRAEDDLG